VDQIIRHYPARRLQHARPKMEGSVTRPEANAETQRPPQLTLRCGRIRDAIQKTRFNGVLGETSFNGLGGTEHAPFLLEPANEGWKRVD